MPSKVTSSGRHFLQKKIQLIGITVLELAIILIVLGGGIATIAITRYQPTPAVKLQTVTADALTTKYMSPDGSFSINFPQYPNVTKSAQNNNGVQVLNNTYIASNSSNDTKYSLQILTYPAYTDYMRDHQRQMLQQIMQQVNDSYAARVITPGNDEQYFCGYSAYKEQFTISNDGAMYNGYALAVLDYNNFYVLVNYGKNTATFNDFIKSFSPKGVCYSTVL